MEEFSKSLTFLHRTLIVAAAAALAFALSTDPSESLIEAQKAVEFVKSADVSGYAAEIEQEYEASKLFSTPQTHDNSADPAVTQQYDRCLKGSEVSVDYLVAIALVPDLNTIHISQLPEYLVRGRVIWLEVAPETIARVLKQESVTCDDAIAQGLKAIRVGTNEIAIKGASQKVQLLSSFYLPKYQTAEAPIQTREEYNFTVMAELAKTARIELEYQQDDTLRFTRFIAKDLASPALDEIDAFAKYFPNQPLGPSGILPALYNASELIGEKTPQIALETLRAEIAEKKKYPSLYGIEVTGSHASWGVPTLTLAVMFFFFVHAQMYRQELSKTTQTLSSPTSVVLYSSFSASVVRIVTIVLLPMIANLLLVSRLSDVNTLPSQLGVAICGLIGITGIVLLGELDNIRTRHRELEAKPPSDSQLMSNRWLP